jgi:hypothetical protein
MWSTFTAGLQMVQEKLLEGEQDEKERVRSVRNGDTCIVHVTPCVSTSEQSVFISLCYVYTVLFWQIFAISLTPCCV